MSIKKIVTRKQKAAFLSEKTPKANKYRAVKVVTGEYKFASKHEAKVFEVFRMREMAKEVVIEKVQDSVFMSDAQIEYRPDFRIRDLKTGEVFWVEAKGLETPEWRIKRRLWAKYGLGRLEVWKGKSGRVELTETVTTGQPLPKATRKKKVK